jgi:hypothetical protein
MTESTTFRTVFGWVPALHFVVAQIQATERLTSEREYLYYFTESSDSILYKLIDSSVEVTCSFAVGTLRTSLDEFSNEVRSFSARVINGLGRQYPRLLENSAIRDILESIEPS